jgi:hypothetical protein
LKKPLLWGEAVSEERGIIRRLALKLTAFLPSDWRGRAGRRFRKTTDTLSDFAERNELQPADIVRDAVRLGRTKLEGLANAEYAAAVLNFNQAEKTKIESELQRRSFESKVRQEEAEARLSELKVLDAEIDLLQKLKDAGVVLRKNDAGGITAIALPRGLALPNPESRRHKRCFLKVKLIVHWDGGAWQNGVNAITMDVSDGGCMAMVGGDVPLNQLVKLTHCGTDCQTDAIVVRRGQGDWDVGLKLVEPSMSFWGARG